MRRRARLPSRDAVNGHAEQVAAGMAASAAVRDVALAQRVQLLRAGWPDSNAFVRVLDDIAEHMAATHDGFRRLAADTAVDHRR